MQPDTTRYRFAEPRQCIYWQNPEQVRGVMQERFELLETYEDQSHLRRYLLRCRECSQLYFFEFYEQIDWADGDDPQYSQYVPVSTAEEAASLASLVPGAQLAAPALCIDFPKDANAPAVYWRSKESS